MSPFKWWSACFHFIRDRLPCPFPICETYCTLSWVNVRYFSIGSLCSKKPSHRCAFSIVCNGQGLFALTHQTIGYPRKMHPASVLVPQIARTLLCASKAITKVVQVAGSIARARQSARPRCRRIHRAAPFGFACPSPRTP